jgi:hypothetical protein
MGLADRRLRRLTGLGVAGVVSLVTHRWEVALLEADERELERAA